MSNLQSLKKPFSKRNGMEERSIRFDRLPNDVLSIIFSYLPRYSYGVLFRICRKWRYVVSQLPENWHLPDEPLMDPAFAGFLQLALHSPCKRLSLIPAMGYIDALNVALDHFVEIQQNAMSVVIKRAVDQPDGSVVQMNITYRIYQPESCLYCYSHRHLQNIMFQRINHNTIDRDIIITGEHQDPGSYVMIEETYLIDLLTRLRPQLATIYCQYLQTLLSPPKGVSTIREELSFKESPDYQQPSGLISPIRMLYQALQKNLQTPDIDNNQVTCVAIPYQNHNTWLTPYEDKPRRSSQYISRILCSPAFIIIMSSIVISLSLVNIRMRKVT